MKESGLLGDQGIDNFNDNIIELTREGVDGFSLDQNMIQWLVLVSTITNPWIP